LVAAASGLSTAGVLWISSPGLTHGPTAADAAWPPIPPGICPKADGRPNKLQPRPQGDTMDEYGRILPSARG